MKPSLTFEELDTLLRTSTAGARVYLIGAGGCGMSGLAHLLLDLGFQVAGSDLVINEEVRQLQSRGAVISRGHSPEEINPGIRLVVYSSAIHPENPQLQAADKLGVQHVRRGVLLAALVRGQRGICVAGMHGKTTTSALLAFALQQLHATPSYAIGALVPQLIPHAHFSTKTQASIPEVQPYFVVEADESDGTLCEFHPEHAIVLNVDAEHLDHFKNIEEITAEFENFARQTRRSLVFCADDSRLAELFARNPHAISYGSHPLAVYRMQVKNVEEAEPQAAGIRPIQPAEVSTPFEVWHKGILLGEFAIRLHGTQNVGNATAVIALLHQLGFVPEEIAEAISSFRGAARRQQELYGDEEVRVFEDYGHHPNEIRATLRALKALNSKRLIVAFQPHRFSRTQHLWKEFATCFGEADLLWLVDLYGASEPEIPGISSGFLAHAIRNEGQPVEAVLPLHQVSQAIEDRLRPGDLVLYLGAGDITHAAHELAERLRSTKLGKPRGTYGATVIRPSGNALTPMDTELYAQLAALLTSDTVLRRDEPLARRTTLRVGGKADAYVEPASEKDLAEVLRFCSQHGIPFVILGRGSNLLIRDGGIRGLVVCLANPRFSQIEIQEERLICGAGARLKQIAVEARRHALSGLEFLEGIPGSLGGAMRMNAGAMGSWLFDVVETIRFMDFAGVLQICQASEVNVEYRGCPLFKNHIALGAQLRGRTAPKESIQARMEVFSRKRWESQPNQPSAGCIFKNPKTIPAGKLLDELGLKGTRVGGAMVSEVHANFIVNDGTATARDVLNLIEVIKERARSARGISLETEVEILGEG